MKVQTNKQSKGEETLPPGSRNTSWAGTRQGRGCWSPQGLGGDKCPGALRSSSVSVLVVRALGFPRAGCRRTIGQSSNPLGSLQIHHFIAFEEWL